MTKKIAGLALAFLCFTACSAKFYRGTASVDPAPSSSPGVQYPGNTLADTTLQGGGLSSLGTSTNYKISNAALSGNPIAHQAASPNFIVSGGISIP
jgi:hypothetical protein